MGLSLRRRHETPAIITRLPISPEQEFTHRRRRYLLMMLGRIVCFFAAVAFVNISIWLSLLLLLGGAVLPWCAVLLANDGPRQKRPNTQIGIMTHSQQEIGPPSQDQPR